MEVFLVATPVFVAIYVVAYFRIFTFLKGADRADAASCCMSLLHGAVTAVLACREVLIRPWLLDAPNSALQNTILEFGLAYFIVDSIHISLLSPNLLFILHHIGGIIYMLSCRAFAGHGALSALSLMGAGELTSPLQNTWTIARLSRKHSPFAASVYQHISLPFTILYTVVRLGLGPFLVYDVARFYVLGGADRVVPRWLAYTWSVIITLAELGSLAWVYLLWAGLIRFYKQRNQVPAKKVE